MAKKRNRLGCLFYLALVLLVLVVFLFSRGRMQEVIEKTGLARLLEKQPETPPEVVVTPLQPEQEKENLPPPAETKGGDREIVISVPETQREEKPQPRSRNSRLFFIAVDGEGNISLKGVIRPVEYVDAPLTATLQALLQGPTSAEVKRGLISLVSLETRLKNVYVKDGTAYVDFNEAFRFNSLGKQGLAAEVKQVVYTATEFPTVKRVQILIDGSVSEYLGPEGVAIGKPLSRESF